MSKSLKIDSVDKYFKMDEGHPTDVVYNIKPWYAKAGFNRGKKKKKGAEAPSSSTSQI